MNLRQLRYFCDTTQNQNFAKTAKKYMVPASSVSAAVKRLEEELGVKLFERTSNKITPTSKGRLFANEIQIAFDRIDNAVDKIKATGKQIPKIKILAKARPKWIAELIVEYMSKHPEVEFLVSNDYALESYNDFDLVIDEPSDKYNGWKAFLLSVEIICIKAAKDSKLVGKELIFEQLKNENFILPSKENGMRSRYENHCKKRGITPNVAIECNDRQLLQYYVQSGLGLTVGAYRALNDNTQGDISPLTVIDFNETQNLYVFYKDSTDTNIALREFCDFLYTQRYIY